MTKLTTIEGIGPAFEEKLQNAGITSCEALLEKGSTSKGRDEIAEASGVDGGRILKFVNHADLMRVKGVGGEYAELLEAAGVDSVPELAQRNADNLAAKMEEINAAKSLVRALPSATSVQEWIAQAKDMEKVVTH